MLACGYYPRGPESPGLATALFTLDDSKQEAKKQLGHHSKVASHAFLAEISPLLPKGLGL
jgi:hypothetical protein